MKLMEAEFMIYQIIGVLGLLLGLGLVFIGSYILGLGLMIAGLFLLLASRKGLIPEIRDDS